MLIFYVNKNALERKCLTGCSLSLKGEVQALRQQPDWRIAGDFA